MSTRLIVLAFLISLTALPLYAQPLGSIKGNLETLEGVPVVGAPVVVQGTQRKTVTDAKGNYLISGLSPGEYDVSVLKHKGYCDVHVAKIIVSSGKTTTQNYLTEPEHSHCGDIIVEYEPPLLWHDPFTSILYLPQSGWQRNPVLFRR